MRRLLPVLLLLLLIPAAAGTTITSEEILIDLGRGQDVTVQRHYGEITSERISLLVPERYNPDRFEARDAKGELDCTVNELDIGTEILCTPRYTTNYSVSISFTGDFTDYRQETPVFAYTTQVLVPTERLSLRVVLPEGYGVAEADGGPSYSPATADTGSEGRRIFLEWQAANVSLGDTYRYRVTYDELAVLERAPPWLLPAIVLLIVGAAAVVIVYLRQNGDGDPETIAAIFPVLKEDEQAVLRYLIDEDGEAEQRDVVQAVEYSKAKVSRLLSDLEDRDIVEKEKSGRINIVRLTREVGDID